MQRSCQASRSTGLSIFSRLRRFVLFSRHGLVLLHGRLLRWRLETFGLYMPSYPHQRPWWRINGRALALLVRHRGAYARWLAEMDAVRRQGAAGWWSSRLGHRYSAFQHCIRRENAPPEEDDHQ